MCLQVKVKYNLKNFLFTKQIMENNISKKNQTLQLNLSETEIPRERESIAHR